MPWTTPRTWTAETLTSTLMNTHLRDNENYLYDQISASAWATFPVSWANLTVGNGTNTGWYAYAGKTTFFRILFTFGSGSSISGSVSVDYPYTAVAYGTTLQVGTLKMLDATGNLYKGAVFHSSTTAMLLKADSVSGSSIIEAVLSSSVPFTWATSDQILIHGFYERA